MKQFRFQPSEIDALDVDDFVSWLEEAVRQNDLEVEAMKKAGNGS